MSEGQAVRAKREALDSLLTNSIEEFRRMQIISPTADNRPQGTIRRLTSSTSRRYPPNFQQSCRFEHRTVHPGPGAQIWHQGISNKTGMAFDRWLGGPHFLWHRRDRVAVKRSFNG